MSWKCPRKRADGIFRRSFVDFNRHSVRLNPTLVIEKLGGNTTGWYEVPSMKFDPPDGF